MESKINDINENQMAANNESNTSVSPSILFTQVRDDEFSGESFETASEDADSDSDYDVDNSETNLDNLPPDHLLCLSPPKNYRYIKRIKDKQRRKSKNKILLNSADYLDKKSTEEMSSLTDSLRNLQEEHLNTSISAPVSSAITSNSARPFGSLNNRNASNDGFCSESRLTEIKDANKSKIFLFN